MSSSPSDTTKSPTSKAPVASSLPDYAPVPRSSLGPALNDQGYYVGRVERNLYWVTDGVYQSAFLTTKDGVVLLDAPPTIGHNLQRAVDEIAGGQRCEQQSDASHLLAPPRRSRRRLVAVQQERCSHRSRGDTATAVARQRLGEARAGGNLPGSPHRRKSAASASSSPGSAPTTRPTTSTSTCRTTTR